MSTRFTIRQSFDIDLERYWAMFLDADYTRRMYTDALGFRFELVGQTTAADGAITRTLRADPPFELPGPAKRVFPDGLGYGEVGRFDPHQKRWSYTLTPRVLADKASCKGVMWAEPRGSARVERIAEIEVAVKILGLGSVMEAFIERVTRDSYQKSAEFTHQWIRNHPRT